jgi:hypothetical protein
MPTGPVSTSSPTFASLAQRAGSGRGMARSVDHPRLLFGYQHLVFPGFLSWLVHNPQKPR